MELYGRPLSSVGMWMWLVLLCAFLLAQCARVESFATPATRFQASTGGSRMMPHLYRHQLLRSNGCHVSMRHTLESETLLLNYPRTTTATLLLQSTSDGDVVEEDDVVEDDLDVRTAATLIGYQSALILVAMGAAYLIGTPNLGLGPTVDFSAASLGLGALYVAPLVAMAIALEVVEERVPALQDVSKATQRSVLMLMGSTFRPLFALMVSVALGLAAGFGEEMLFRGVVQYEVANRLGMPVAVVVSSVVFGLLHAVTPLYAILAALGSVYFGYLYIVTDNLVVPITCHALYDVGALLYAHWTISRLSPLELEALRLWDGPESEPRESADSR